MSSYRPGAIGTLNGTLGKVDYKTSAKGKRWATFEIKRGKQTIKMKSFVAGVVTMLESFVEGEEVSVFGKLDTSFAEGGKDYTNFVALKLYDDLEDDSGMSVTGEVLEIKAHEYGNDVLMDITEDPAYPTKLKFQVSKGVKVPYQIGQVYSGIKLEPRGKFSFWTLDAGLPQRKEAATAPGGKVVVDMSEVTYEYDDAPPAGSVSEATAVANNTAADFDDDIPF